MRRMLTLCLASVLILARGLAIAQDGSTSAAGVKKLNNLVALLLDAAPTPGTESFSFERPGAGWIFIFFATRGDGDIRLTLDKGSPQETPIYPAPGSGPAHEAV